MDALMFWLRLQIPWLADPLHSTIFWIAVAGLIFCLFTWGVPRITQNTKTEIDDIIVGILRIPLLVVTIAYGVLDVLRLIQQFKGWIDPIKQVFTLIVIWVITWLVLRVITDIVKRYAQEYAEETESNLDDVFVPLVTSAGPLIVIVIALILTVQVFSPAFLGQLLTVIGALSFILIFLFQEPLSNLFSGVYLWLGSPFKYGDMVTLEDGITYRVEEIGTRVTKLYNITNHTVAFLPNSKLAGQQLINRTRPTVELRDWIKVGIAYGTKSDNIEEIQNLMTNLANASVHTLGPWGQKQEDLPVLKNKKELVSDRIKDLHDQGHEKQAEDLERERQRLEVEYRMREQNEVIRETLQSLRILTSNLEVGGLRREESAFIEMKVKEIRDRVTAMRRDLTIWVRWSTWLQAVYRLGPGNYPPLNFTELEASVSTINDWQEICEKNFEEKDRIRKFIEVGKIPLIGTFQPDTEFMIWGPGFLSDAYRLSQEFLDQAQIFAPSRQNDPIRDYTSFEFWKFRNEIYGKAIRALLSRLNYIGNAGKLRREKQFQLDDYISETAKRFEDKFMLRVPSFQQPVVEFVGFGNSSLDFELSYFVDDLIGDHFERLGHVRSDIGIEIKKQFDVKSIEIPFPQQDVWFRNKLIAEPNNAVSAYKKD